MKYFNKIFLAVTVAGFLLSSCNKDDVNDGITNQEKTILKLPQAGDDEPYNFALDAVPGNTTLEVLEVRRDAISEAELNKPLTVKISPNQAMIDDYNAAHPNNKLSLFTNYTNDAGNPFDGSAWTLNFAPGEFVKYIKIIFDPTTMDFSKRNVLAFKLEPTEGVQISNAANEAFVEVAVKNKYDGVYNLTGTLVDNVNAGLGPYDQEVSLITTGANTVKMVPTDLGFEGHLIYDNVNAGVSYYGSFGPVFEFDPATDKVIGVKNIYGQPAGNTRSAELDPSGDNFYDPVSKEIRVSYFMKQPSLVPTPPNIRVRFNEVFTYVGPR
ncbi:hypothetical protein [Pollutibacter soli]|uniref:hypothetical protein n=1 Tax=Pollutibacter soli TaxID=3034157 RepID=UPI0030132838